MRIDRTVALAALLGATAVGFASLTWADGGGLNGGKYNVVVSGVSAPGNTAAMWTVNP